MIDPVYQVLFGLRCELSPNIWQLTIKEGCSKGFEISTHTNLTLKCSLEINDRTRHSLSKFIETLKLLQQDSLSGRDDIVEGLSNIVLVEDLRKSVRLNTIGDIGNHIFTINTSCSTSCGCLHFHDVSPELLGRVVEVSDFGIRVQTEYTWRCEDRNGVNEIKVSFV